MPALLFVGIKAVIIQDGKLLVLKRARGMHGPFWEVPGGRMETGETIEATLRRELQEEIHVVPTAIGKVKAIYKKPEILPEGNELFLTFVAVTLPAQATITISNEHTEYRWVNKAEASTFTPPLNALYDQFLL